MEISHPSPRLFVFEKGVDDRGKLTVTKIMTELLQQAISQIQQLPPDQQDAIAARFIAELQDEQKWETRFVTTTDEQWDQMAAMVYQEIAGGETIPLHEFFPSKKRNQVSPKRFVSY
jgi:hypothetical protein